MSKWNPQNAWSNAFAHFYFGDSTTYSLNEKKNIENVCYRAKEWDKREGVKIEMGAFK